MNIQSIREQINLFIYGSKEKVLTKLNILSLFVSLSSLLLLVYYYGFQHTIEEEHSVFVLIQISFGFYILRYLIRIFYDFSPKTFIKNNKLETVFISFLIIDAISYNIFDLLIIQSFFLRLGFHHFTDFSNLFLQSYILIIVFIDLQQDTDIIPKYKFNPATIFIATFVILISVGTGLLLLPEMTVLEGSMNFIDALFTATSASCVTGLIVVDTGTFFTFKGHVVLLLLMQLGGLNIVSFGSFLVFFNRFGLGMKHHAVVEDFVFKNSIFSGKGLLSKIIIGTFTFEIIGAIFIFWVMSDRFVDQSIEDTIFFAVFHAVSAFNNAGFSTMTDGMYNELYQHFFLLHLVLGILVFFGAIGFDTFYDLFSKESLREKLKYPWKRYKIGSLLNVYTSVGLTVIAMILILVFEESKQMADYSTLDKLITSFFQAVSARTAGFNSIDYTSVSIPLLLFSLLFMFVGGGSSSSAGGIKTSTFSVLLVAAYSIIRSKKHIEIFKRTIPNDVIFRAISVFVFSLACVFVGTFVLTITEQHLMADNQYTLIDLIFEQTSAFATTGISTGITSQLTDSGKTTIILSMFIGRLGTLTIAYALSKGIVSTNYKYPEESMLIG